LTRPPLDQRLEDARAHEQAEDFARQEKILKLISTELTRNTTRVVEMAVKNEVQNSVLPSLENITKNEVRAAFNDQIERGLGDYISQVGFHIIRISISHSRSSIELAGRAREITFQSRYICSFCACLIHDSHSPPWESCP
jgi:hypothetical protein